MKQVMRRAAALFLSVALMAGTAFASNALGDDLHAFSIPLAEGASLTTQIFWSNSKSNLQTENYITFSPNSSLAPKVSYGPNVVARRTVSSMAADLEKQGERVLSGINGDFFVMASGSPVGIVITDGILRSSPSDKSNEAVAFMADGSAIIGTPNLTMTAKFSNQSFKIGAINKVRESKLGYHLLSEDFAPNTQNTQAGVDVILTPVREALGTSVTADNGQTVVLSDELKIGSRVPCVVEQVVQSTSNIQIPKGKFVMTINQNSDQALVSALTALQPGATMDIDITSADVRWNNVDASLGAQYRILANGKVNSEWLTDSIATSVTCRTAIGVKADGTVIFYTIDGLQSGLSLGATMVQVANRLKELGCVNASCLDGGGSTTLGATTPGQNGFEVINSPSGGSQRTVSNALFLVSNLSPSGVPGRLHLEPKERVVLAKGNTPVTAAFVDTNWYPVSGSETFTWSAQKGTVSADGVYTAPTTGGQDTITATSASGLTGTTTVTVFDAPTGISLANKSTGKAVTSLTVSGKESVSLKASAVFKKIPLTAQNESFQWSLSSESLGTITPSGVFTAGTTSGSGTLKVSSGSLAVTIPVTVNVAPESVTIHTMLLDNFEGDKLSFQNATGATLYQESAADFVRYGKQSLRLDYSLTRNNVQIPASFPVDIQKPNLTLWVYGDNSGNQISAMVRDDTDTEQSLVLGTLNFKGWKQLSAVLPANATDFTGLSVFGDKQTGTLYVDQLMLSDQTVLDRIAPKVNLALNGTQLSATLSDNATAVFSKDQISLTLDGKEQDFSVNGATVTATLPEMNGFLHRVSLTVSDASGNLARASKDVGSTASNNSSYYADMKNHWAAGYTDYLSSREIVKGNVAGSVLKFNPDQAITRGDFALMTARWMGLDLGSYSSTSLPFADKASIPSWSLDAVKAMYSLGIMKGSQGQNGLYAYATSSITRAEAMTILGRIQPKGYPQAALSAFQDAGSIPSWAKEHVASLVGQGVVGGFAGKLNPTDAVSRAELCKMLFTLW